MPRKSMLFVHILGTIMYVGTILAHIASGIIADGELQAVYYAAIFQERTAYMFIIPGIILKTVSGIFMYRQYKQKPLWLKIKVGLAVYLAVNAFFILTPLMSDLRILAEESLKVGMLTEEFKAKEHLAMLAGMSNVIPLILAMTFGVFKPKFKKS
jgi:hypothetical protein